MAYQPPSPGANMNGANGGQQSPVPGPGPGEHMGPPQGTEYTLQGVMRFLQIEWHNHERARNAWAIERAEMKARIARLEGEGRQARRINEQLVKQVGVLGRAVRAARGGEGKGEGEDLKGMFAMGVDLDLRVEC